MYNMNKQQMDTKYNELMDKLNSMRVVSTADFLLGKDETVDDLIVLTDDVDIYYIRTDKVGMLHKLLTTKLYKNGQLIDLKGDIDVSIDNSVIKGALAKLCTSRVLAKLLDEVDVSVKPVTLYQVVIYAEKGLVNTDEVVKAIIEAEDSSLLRMVESITYDLIGELTSEIYENKSS